MQSALTTLGWLANNREAIFRAIEFSGFIVGIVALIIAAIEFRHVRTLLDNSALLSRETAQIANSMSTGFIGEFPYNLSAITEVLKQAKAHVEIMVDIAAYGHYSNPEDFLPYFQQLEKLALAKQVRLRMIVYDEKLNEAGRDDQFGGQPQFAAIQADRRFKQYFAKHKEDSPADYASFIKILQERERNRKITLETNEAEIQDSSERFRFFLWLVDDVEAVFAFQICGEHFREICFRTKDGNLIHTFADLFRQAWGQRAKPQTAAGGQPAAATVGTGIAPPPTGASIPPSASPATTKVV